MSDVSSFDDSSFDVDSSFDDNDNDNDNNNDNDNDSDINKKNILVCC